MRHCIHTDASGHVWVFMWSEETVVQLLRLLGWYAVDPKTTFSWYDAGIVSKQVRAINWSAKRGDAQQTL